MIALSEVEGRRFGLRAGRIEAVDIDADALQIEVVEGEWDWLVLRLPTGAEACVERLRARGLEPQPVDTLMTWSVDPGVARLGTSIGDMDLRPAQVGDSGAIEALVRSVFARYSNHYTANPWLDRTLALEGYVEWALSHIDHPDCLCWIVRIGDEIAGLSCSRHDPATRVAVGVLHGVDPRFSGRGVYRTMIEASLRHYRNHDYREFRISTQAGNHTVQNLWAQLGLRLAKSQFTLHLMPLLGLASAAPSEPVKPFSSAASESLGGAGAVMRRSACCLPGRAIEQATRIRRAQWPGSHGMLRRIEVMCDDTDRVLGWNHLDCAADTHDEHC